MAFQKLKDMDVILRATDFNGIALKVLQDTVSIIGFGRPFRAILWGGRLPGLKPWAILFSPFGRRPAAVPGGGCLRSGSIIT
jgi:hypothetical protein